jgi:CDP-6-deoxy-D-xylo-4-hexulose-3-dehydrase
MIVKKNNFQHKLMFNNIELQDLKKVKIFLNKENIILTQSKKVLEFEKKWSKWLGVKYSVFVNSGSSANYLTMLSIKITYGEKGEVIVPSLTWISDIVSVINSGFKPVFVDINLDNLCMEETHILKSLTKKTKAVFITHAQGFNGLSENLLKVLKKRKILLIEDVCESHGATFKGKKLGSFGEISNFSFYYAHHLSTIEGGMICTNNKKIYETVRMLRSHGMVRESGNDIFEKKMIKKYSDLSPKFIFMYPGFNMRNNEISAVIGINQLKRLDYNNRLRSKNFAFFLKNLDPNIYKTDFNLEGNSNYAFPLILKKASFQMRDKLEKLMIKNGIEFRRGNAGGGNQLRQPYLKKYFKRINFNRFKNVEHVHFFGYYIGNYPSLKKEKINKICNILNSLE